MVIRRAGAFSAPIELGSATDLPELAAARGGWAAVAWLARRGREVALTLVVVAPDGRQTRTVLERSRTVALGSPRIGIGPAGDVVALWSRFERDPARVRVARVPAGAPPVFSDLPGALSPRSSGALYAVAVAPGGATLLAWAAEDGLRTVTDGGEPVVLSPGGDASSVTAALNDAGAALVAHGTAAGEVVVTDRAPGGPWAAPRVLDAVAGGPLVADTEGAPVRGSVLAADGRAIVAWSDARAGLPIVAAANGRAGGSWSGPAALSAITREGFSPSLSLDALGEPRALWSELGVGVRGARLAPAATDVTPPAVSARLPARTRLSRSGRFRLSVPVRCSEACDVRLSVRDTGIARALPAGRTVTLRYLASAELGEQLLLRPRLRRPRVDLVVTDRAGNVVRTSRVVRRSRVRVPG